MSKNSKSQFLGPKIHHYSASLTWMMTSIWSRVMAMVSASSRRLLSPVQVSWCLCSKLCTRHQPGGCSLEYRGTLAGSITWSHERYRVFFSICFKNEVHLGHILGLLRSPKASLGPQGRAQITFRYRRHIYGLNCESRWWLEKGHISSSGELSLIYRVS